ncbi:MAG TPA: YkgJ family cysteine cluster protein [Armatimonadota bacterium]|nr:YkgJ family cysteine cluster protein [Armatimonadota bacterium]
MSDSESSSSEWVLVNTDLLVGGQRLHAELPVPAGKALPEELLPILQALTDAVVDVAISRVAAEGQAITCQKGCGACCRQLVPISEAEARALSALVETFPENRRREIRERTMAARKTLQEAGLLERLEHPERYENADLHTLGLEYFRAGIACPFLEAESCSIHSDRPLACREYLVTTPAIDCAHPTPDTVHRVDLPAKVSTALTRIDVKPGARFVRWAPLILSLDWAASHPATEPLHTGPELLKIVLSQMMRRSPTGPEKSASNT